MKCRVLGVSYIIEASLTGSAPHRDETKTTTDTDPSTPVSRKQMQRIHQEQYGMRLELLMWRDYGV